MADQNQRISDLLDTLTDADSTEIETALRIFEPNDVAAVVAERALAGGGGGGGSIPDPIPTTVRIAPATGDASNSGLRIESPALATDYSYVLIALLETAPDTYDTLFHVDSAGEITGIARDFAGGAVPFSLVDPDNVMLFRVDQNATANIGAGGVKFPTSDPHIAGAWWDNAGTLTKSAG